MSLKLMVATLQSGYYKKDEELLLLYRKEIWVWVNS